MITINFRKATPQGSIDGIYRFLGKFIFIQKKNKNVVEPILTKFKQAGAEVLDIGEWLRIDLFKISDVIKLGESEINIEEKPEDIELKLSNFYIQKLKEMGFIVTIL